MKPSLARSSLSLLSVALALAGCAATGLGDREPDEAFEQDPLLSEAQVPHRVVAEAFVSASTPEENVDSPAAWQAPDGTRWVIATAKATHRLLVYAGDDGRLLRTVGGPGDAAGQFRRPNGIAVTDDPGSDPGRALLWVVERDNRRIQLLRLPEFEPLATFGEQDLEQPYGLWVRPLDDGYEVLVSDNYMSPHDDDVPPPLAELDRRFKRYHVSGEEADWQARLLGTFGATDEAGAIRIAESLSGDVEHDRLLLAEEDVATGTRLREYGLDGRYRGRDIGADVFRAQAEGIALRQCADGTGQWIVSDQFKDRTLFHLFDRISLDHIGAFAGERTANTDGVWLDQSGGARFPDGVFYAIDDDQALAAFDWRDIAAALALPECEAT